MLGSKTRISGGPYTFIEEAFGKYAGFLAGNLYLLGALASDAALANALSDTLQTFIPQLRTDLYRMFFQFMIFGGLALLQLRRKQIPVAQKTFRVPGGVIIPLVAVAGTTWLLSNSSKAEATGLTIFILIFSAIYFVTQLLKKRNNP